MQDFNNLLQDTFSQDTNYLISVSPASISHFWCIHLYRSAKQSRLCYITSLPRRNARVKDPQHPKILGSKTKESPALPSSHIEEARPTNPESCAPAHLRLEWHRMAEPEGRLRALCRGVEGRHGSASRHPSPSTRRRQHSSPPITAGG